ncbi:MAG: PadR family transcriptional regulator, partial [Mycobacterium sp.]|nr:PadR family transcriptional regulator [Mycobacterium sp.]
MNHPFSAPAGGFGFGPIDRRSLHHQHRQARRELRGHLGEHAGSESMGPGFGPGFGRGRGAGFDPRGGFDFGFD